jgi:hypothetical protein
MVFGAALSISLLFTNVCGAAFPGQGWVIPDVFLAARTAFEILTDVAWIIQNVFFATQTVLRCPLGDPRKMSSRKTRTNGYIAIAPSTLNGVLSMFLLTFSLPVNMPAGWTLH